MKKSPKERARFRRLLAAAAGVLGLVSVVGLSSSTLTDAQWTGGQHVQAVADAGTVEPMENLRCSGTGFGHVANLVVSWNPPETGLAVQGYLVELYGPGSSGSLIHQEVLPAGQRYFDDFEYYLSHSRAGNVLEARFSVVGPGDWKSEQWIVEVEASLWALIFPRVACDIEGPWHGEGFSDQPLESLPPEEEEAELPEEEPSEAPDPSQGQEESNQEEGHEEQIPPEETQPPEEDQEEPVEEAPAETPDPSESQEEPEEDEVSGAPSAQ